jgi:hypothetical protein
MASGWHDLGFLNIDLAGRDQFCTGSLAMVVRETVSDLEERRERSFFAESVGLETVEGL